MQENRPIKELTPEQMNDYTGAVLTAMQQLIKFAIDYRTPPTE